MSNNDSDDEKPGKVPRPEVIVGRLRRYAQDIEDRDGSVGRRPRTAELEYPIPEDASVKSEVTEDITDVHQLTARVVAALKPEDVSPSTIRLTAEIVKVLWGHVASAEKRRGTGDMQVLAAQGGEDIGGRLDKIDDSIHEIHTELDDVRGLRPARINGKIGNLAGQVRMLRGVMVAISLAVLGGVVGTAKALYTAGETRGAERAQFVRVRDTVDTLSEQVDQIRLRLFGIPPVPAGLPGVIP